MRWQVPEEVLSDLKIKESVMLGRAITPKNKCSQLPQEDFMAYFNHCGQTLGVKIERFASFLFSHRVWWRRQWYNILQSSMRVGVWQGKRELNRSTLASCLFPTSHQRTEPESFLNVGKILPRASKEAMAGAIDQFYLKNPRYVQNMLLFLRSHLLWKFINRFASKVIKALVFIP